MIWLHSVIVFILLYIFVVFRFDVNVVLNAKMLSVSSVRDSFVHCMPITKHCCCCCRRSSSVSCCSQAQWLSHQWRKSSINYAKTSTATPTFGVHQSDGHPQLPTCRYNSTHTDHVSSHRWQTGNVCRGLAAVRQVLKMLGGLIAVCLFVYILGQNFPLCPQAKLE